MSWACTLIPDAATSHEYSYILYLLFVSVLPTILFVLSARGSSTQALSASSPIITYADSLAATQQVFQYKRRWSRIGTLGFGLSMSAQAIILATGDFTPIRRDLLLLSSAIYTGFGLVALRDWHRFSQRHERQAVASFEAHQVQPSYMRQQVSTYLSSSQQR